MAQKEKKKINESLSELESIASWFDSQKEIDVEEGLVKAKAAAALIKELRTRLRDVENEFKEVRAELEEKEGEE